MKNIPAIAGWLRMTDTRLLQKSLQQCGGFSADLNTASPISFGCITNRTRPSAVTVQNRTRWEACSSQYCRALE